MSRTFGLTLLASSLLLAACGSSQPGGAGSPSSSTPTTPTQSTSEPTSPATSSEGKWSTGKPVPSSPTTVGGFTSLSMEQLTSALLQKTQVPSGPWADATSDRPDPAIALLDRVHVSSPECGEAVQSVKAVLTDQGSASDVRAFTSRGIVPQSVRVALRVASGDGALTGAAAKLTRLGTACSAKIAVPDEAVTVRPARTTVKDAAAAELVSKAAGRPTALAVASRGANTVIVSVEGVAGAAQLATQTLAEQVTQVEKAAR